jgi:ATP-binding protein involved in chromosome partitioning
VLADEADAPLLGRVQLDVELRRAGDSGTPVVLASPEATSARELTRIALPTPRRSLAGRRFPLSVV